MSIKDMVVEAKKWVVPARWLAHYLFGGGRPMVMTEKVLGKDAGIVGRFIMWATGVTEPGESRKELVTTGAYAEYFEPGFWAKPVLFYTVGGFTATVCIQDNGILRVVGEDVYDWHPTKRESVVYFDDAEGVWVEEDRPGWFWTPLPEGVRVPELLCRLVNRLFGSEVLRPDSVSNELWAKLPGRAFVTHIDLAIDVRNKEILAAQAAE